MPEIWKTIFFINLILISSSLCALAEEANDDSNEDSSDSEKDLGTISPKEFEKLKEEIIEQQKEDSEKFGLPLTSSPEEVEEFLKEGEKEYGEELPEKIEEGFTEVEEIKKFVHFLQLFDKIKNEAEDFDNDDVAIVEKSPAEMKEMKEELYRLTNELEERQGLPPVPQEEFDTLWDKKKEEYGEKFPGKIEKLIAVMKTAEEIEDELTTPVKQVSESAAEVSTPGSEISKEESLKGAFVVRGAKGNICILAKFHSVIIITYAGKSSEQKIEVSVPSNGHTKGKCGGKERSMQISWGKFVFSLVFNKTSEDSWDVTSVELSYDTSEPIFDGAAERVKVTAKSEKVNLFETPLGKSCFCPAQEVILLYSENQHVATVRLKEVHLQPYDVEDGKFSSIHRCSKVVIGGPDEEPFVQDETIPLAVGLTLAVVTLLILVGFSVHRAYTAAKVDYNAMP